MKKKKFRRDTCPCHEKEKSSKRSLSVDKFSKPLNNPLVSTNIAYEALFLRYFNFLKISVGKKETKG